jgi:hypothetical protein
VYFRSFRLSSAALARENAENKSAIIPAWNLDEEYSTTRVRSLFITAPPHCCRADRGNIRRLALRRFDPAGHLVGKEGLIGRRHAIAGRVGQIGFR